MSFRRITILIVFIVFAAGCMPKCPPAPALTAVVNQDNPLPFRTCELSIEAVEKEEWVKDRMLISFGLFHDVWGITTQALYDSNATNNDAHPVVAVRIKVKGMSQGSASIWGRNPAFYAARYELVDVADGSILFEKEYSGEKDYAPGEYGCGSTANGVAAFLDVLNEVTNHFLDDVSGIAPKNNVMVADGRVHGTLKFVGAGIPATKDNVRWMLGKRMAAESGQPFWSYFQGKLLTELPAAITRRIQGGKLFDHSKGSEYTVLVVIPEIDASPETIFHKQSNAFHADAVISKDGKEVGSVEIGPSDYGEHDSFETIADLYSRRIVEKLRELAKGEGK